MKTARQPTIKTWFVFAALFAIPLALPNDYLTVQLGRNGEKVYNAIFAAGSTVPLVVALVVALCVRRFLWIAILCFILRSIWFVTVLIVLDNGNAIHWNMVSHWLTGLASSVWIEWWSLVLLSQNGFWKDSASNWLSVIALSSTLYSIMAVLLAMTCRLREPRVTRLAPSSESPVHSPGR